MPNEIENSSFIDQIICQTITLLSERIEFNEEDLERLERLLRSDSAANSDRVVDVLNAGGKESS